MDCPRANDPAGGNKLANVANLGPKDAAAAIAAGNAAWPAWRNNTGMISTDVRDQRPARKHSFFNSNLRPRYKGLRPKASKTAAQLNDWDRATWNTGLVAGGDICPEVEQVTGPCDS